MIYAILCCYLKIINASDEEFDKEETIQPFIIIFVLVKKRGSSLATDLQRKKSNIQRIQKLSYLNCI